ncbi:hypothetical protein STEG23_034766, partial [Scotinomys teguina]
NGNGLCDVLGSVLVDKCLYHAALPWIPPAHLPAAPPAQTRKDIKPSLILCPKGQKTLMSSDMITVLMASPMFTFTTT